ncbi:MAG: hypothetical protein JNL84_14385 [Candidatus Accumulibacter sp.]|nr:hypothetical protein [Accumulibacter sp.]
MKTPSLSCDSFAFGDSSSAAHKLGGTIDATRIASNYSSFAALRADGSVVTWGDRPFVGWNFGGNSSAVADQIDGTNPVTQVFGNDTAFAALAAASFRSGAGIGAHGAGFLGDLRSRSIDVAWRSRRRPPSRSTKFAAKRTIFCIFLGENNA